MITVKLGFVPTYRFHYSDWCCQMHTANRAVLTSVPGVEIIDIPVAKTDSSDNPADTCSVPYGAVHTLDEAEIAAKALAGVDGIVVCPLDFGDERAVARVAEILKVPVLLYATKEPPAENDNSLSRSSDSYCGTLSIASALYRRKLPFVFAGIFFPQDAGLKEAFETFARALSVVSGMRGARIGQIGVRPPSFETVSYDERALARAFGQHIIYRNIDDIVASARAIPDTDPQLRRYAEDLRGTVAVSTVDDGYFVSAARLQVAISTFFTQERLSAMGMQCWPSVGRDLGIEMCALFGWLTGKGMLTACETDILGALSMLIQHRASMGQVIPHFIDWTIRHRTEENTFLAWHCGNAPTCLAADPSKTALRTRANMKGVPDGGGKGGLYQFQIRSGVVTLCRLAEYDGEFKLLITKGTIVPSDETLAGTWAWVRVADHDRLYRTLVEEGFIHHASMIHGDQQAALVQACKFLNIKTVIV